MTLRRALAALVLSVVLASGGAHADGPIHVKLGTDFLVVGNSLTAGFLTGVSWIEPLRHFYDGRFLHTTARPAISARATSRFFKSTIVVGPDGAGANYDPIWIQSGVSGNTVAQINARYVAAAAGLQASRNLVVVIEAGTNNLFDDPTAFRADVNTLLATIQTVTPGAQIAWVNIMANGGSVFSGEQYPDPRSVLIDPLNTQIALGVVSAGGIVIDVRSEEQAHEQTFNIPPPGASIFDLTVDGVHPTAVGRQLICDKTATYISLVGNVN